MEAIVAGGCGEGWACGAGVAVAPPACPNAVIARQATANRLKISACFIVDSPGFNDSVALRTIPQTDSATKRTQERTQERKREPGLQAAGSRRTRHRSCAGCFTEGLKTGRELETDLAMETGLARATVMEPVWVMELEEEGA